MQRRPIERMKFRAPAYSDDDGNSHGDGEDQRQKMAAAGDDCPSQLSDERTELLELQWRDGHPVELQWRDGHPVEQPVHNLDHSNDTAGHVDACAPGEKKNKAAAAAGGPNKADRATLAVEPVEEWWKLWREGENYGGSSAAAYGYPMMMQQVDANSSSVNAEKQVHDESTGDELWRLWREGHGSSAPQDSTCKTTNSVLKSESLLPSSGASGGSGAQRHSSEQIEERCSTLDQAIEYMKSLQQQIQVLSSGGYAMQPLLYPCICSQAPHPAAVPAAAPLHPVPCALPQPPQPSLAAPLYQALPPPIPAADMMNPVMVPIGGQPGGASGMFGMSTGLADKMP